MNLVNARWAAAAFLGTSLLFATACGPSETDKKNMAEKMDLETQQAKIWDENAKDCKKLDTEFKAFRKKNGERLKALDDWWGGVGKGAKDKLIEEHRAAWDRQSGSMIKVGLSCPEEWKAGMGTY